MTTLSRAEARNLAIHTQLLNDASNITPDKNGVYDIINHLGYVQLDTLSVIKRAHHHTLWNRHPKYDPEMLLELQRDDKRIFEYWGHAASYLPMKDYRFYQHRMNNADDPNSGKGEFPNMQEFLTSGSFLADCSVHCSCLGLGCT